jgi:iron(III) transport system substrate-binding protein
MRLCLSRGLVWLAWSVGLPASVSAAELTVYSAVSPPAADVAIRETFVSTHPDIKVSWTRDVSGVIISKVLAERDNPRADAVIGVPVSIMISMMRDGAIEAFKPSEFDKLNPKWRDPSSPPSWIGMGGYITGLCVNEAESKAAGVEPPRNWEDLTAPRFKNRIAMPNPASSGLGYLMVAGWLQNLGEDRGWAFMDALHQNVAVYLHSGLAACSQTARGERLVGLGADILAAIEISKGAPLTFVVPSDLLMWDQDTAGLIKGARNPEAAKQLLDFLSTRDANEIYGRFFWTVARPDVTPNPPDRPGERFGSLSPMDPTWMAANRDRVLAEWSRRYNSKSAPKP